MTASPIISEFMAINSGGLQDQDGDSSDWLEIYNPGDDPIDLTGWHLTDDPGFLDKWTFPATTLAGGNFLIVFASDKNRAIAGAELHLNFKLSGLSDYLALVQADGSTVAHAYDPYPDQIENISYGIGQNVEKLTFIEAGDPVKYHVPTSGALGEDWTGGVGSSHPVTLISDNAPLTYHVPSSGALGTSWTGAAVNEPFNDSPGAGWTAGTAGLGFEVLDPGSGGTVILDDFNDGVLDANWTVDNPGTATVTETGGSLRIVSSGVNNTGSTRQTAPFVYRPTPASGDYSIVTKMDISAFTTTTLNGLMVYDQADGLMGLSLQRLNTGTLLLQSAGTGHTLDATPPGGGTGVTAVWMRMDRVSGPSVVWNVFAKYAESDPWTQVKSLTEGAGLLPIITPRPGVMVRTLTAGSSVTANFDFFQITQGNTPPETAVYDQVISTDAVTAMHGVNASAYVRVPFNVADDPADFDRLTLDVKYDDGFVAYLNGVEVARHNAPGGTPAFNAAATSAPSDAQSLAGEIIDLSAFTSALRSGTNILAFHALNASAADKDFLLIPKLTGRVVDDSGMGPVFDDADWASGTLGLGYELSVPGFAVKNYKANTTVGSLSAAESVVANPGLQSNVVSENKPVINYFGTGGDGHYANNSPFPGTTAGQDVEDFVVVATAQITIPAAGPWTFGVNSDDGFQLNVGTFVSAFPDPRGPADTLATFNFPAAGVYSIRALMYERGGGSGFEVFAAQGTHTSWNTNFDLVGDTANGGLRVDAEIVGTGGGSSGFGPLIATDVETQMYNQNASIYARVPFDVADPMALTSLTLSAKYDDGFVAYLNGTEIARRNAPAIPVFNSAATIDRPSSSALLDEIINITPYLGLVQQGTNMLAIHGLNSAVDSGDFLLNVELAQITVTGEAELFFAVATPGAVNSNLTFAGVRGVNYSVPHGLFDASFDLEISTPTEGATIRYTLDGSEPTATTGAIYTGPITISSTRTVRAAGFKASFTPSDILTQTYIFPEQVKTQNTPAGYPLSWGSGAADYQVDPDVVNNPAYAATFANDLKTIPTMSIVMELEDIFGASGIYSNPRNEGIAWERPGSFELIYPDGSEEGFSVNAGVRIQGGVGRYEQFYKHSFRLLFKGDYGPSKLKYDLFGEGATDSFDTLVLRAGFNNSYVIGGGESVQAEYMRDEFARRTQLAMGQPAAHGNFVHLYLNGLYWGLYNLTERPDAPFMASYLGGEKEEYDALNSSEPIDGDKAAWNTLNSLISAGTSTPAQYAAIKQYLDVPNLIDYFLMNFYGGNLDWDDHNWYAGRKREPGAGYKFFSWDAERTLEGNTTNRTGVNQGDKPSFIYNGLRANAEFRMQFADQAHKHLFNGGAMTVQASVARFQELMAEIDRAIVGESARWGDTTRATPMTRDIEWVNETNRIINNHMPQRTNELLNQLRAASLYPATVAPVFSQHGGLVNFSQQITITAPAGQIYYTLDGSDPRLEGGALNPNAIPYSGSVTFTESKHMRARVRNGADWSALNEATFLVRMDDLRITEIMYNPYSSNILEDANVYEFIELKNVGPNTLNLAGVSFTNGIDFSFSGSAVTSLAPGQHVVLVSNAAQFAMRYNTAGMSIAGQYTGQLSNGGERLRLVDAFGQEIADFDYSDGWYSITDGDGFSLNVVDQAGKTADQDQKSAWRPSAMPNGSPGADDAGLAPGSVMINEIAANETGGNGDWIEIINLSSAQVDLSGWFLSDNPLDLTKYRIADGTLLNPGQMILFTQAAHFGMAGGPGVNTTFDLNHFGGDALLTSSAGLNIPGGYREDKDFEASEPGRSFGRHIRSTGGSDFVPMATQTPGSPNSLPFIGPVVINEIMYNPAGLGVEFIELLNITNAAVPLHDEQNPANGWIFDSGFAFTFPETASIPANGYALVVPIDPADFRTQYNIPAQVPIYGPYVGMLENNGENIKLLRPLFMDGPLPAYGFGDRVEYDNNLPWPTTADGLGAALSRVSPTVYGNDVVNWISSTTGGTPGALNVGIDSSPPTVPGNVAASVLTGTQVLLTWNASVDPQTNVDHYVIYRNNTMIGTTTARHFIDAVSFSGTAFSYQVSAVNGDTFESARSAAAQIAATTVEFQDGLNGYNGTRDLRLAQGTPTTNFATGTPIKIDGEDGGFDLNGLLRFGNLTLPAGSVVQDAGITINVTNPTANTYGLYQSLRNWEETQATWNVFATGQNWQVAGGSGTADRGPSILASFNFGGTGQRYSQLSADGIALVQGWVNGTIPNYGFNIFDAASTDGLEFDSREATTPTNRPKLTITYLPGDSTQPAVMASQFLDSVPEVVSFDFNEYVIIDSTDLIVTNTDTSQVMGGAVFDYEPADKRATWTLPTLGPGTYSAVLQASNITDATGNILNGAGLTTVQIVRLLGDANRDGAVNSTDIDYLFDHYAASNADPMHDLDGDGDVDLQDVTELVQNVFGAYFGDADLNQQVSIGDLTILAENFGSPGNWAQGDFNGDGGVSIGDLTLLAENFGQGAPGLTGEGFIGEDDGGAAALLASEGAGADASADSGLAWNHIDEAACKKKQGAAAIDDILAEMSA